MFLFQSLFLLASPNPNPQPLKSISLLHLPCPLIAEVVGGDDGNVAQHNHCPNNVTRCHSLREHIILQHQGHHHLRVQDNTPQSKMGLADLITHTHKGDGREITTAPTQLQLRGSLGSMGICSRKKPGIEPTSPTKSNRKATVSRQKGEPKERYTRSQEQCLAIQESEHIALGSGEALGPLL